MKLVILGTSAAFAAKNDGCPSYLLSINNKNYIVDTGPGCVSFLQNYIDCKNINAIFLSHLHADHYTDLLTLRYAIYVARRDGYMKTLLPIYMPKHPKKTFKFIRDTIKNDFLINEITENLTLNIDNLKVSFKKTRHPIPAFAMRFEYNEKSIVYTSDTAYFDDIVSFSKNANILLSEATLQNIDENLEELGHMTAKKAGKLALKSDAERLVLTHLWPEYDKKISLSEAKEVFNKEIILAERGKEILL